MFQKFEEMATRTANNASRRQFLGRLGQSALAAATLVSGIFTTDAAFARKPPRPPLACGAGSQTYCAGSVEGAVCFIGTTAGLCVGAPACYCRPASGPRGGGRGRSGRRSIFRQRRRRNKRD
jgi:hypothetical protein